MAVHLSGDRCDCLLPSISTTKLALLWKVFILVILFAGCEFLMGHISHSLALQADSGHMLSDGLALAIALGATWIARRSTPLLTLAVPQSRIELWAALINGLGLLVMAGLIVWEACCHLQAPPTEILSVPMLITAVVGLVVNGINVGLLHGGDDQDLNLRGALLHVIADVISSVGVIVAAIAVWIWGWTWADGVISLGVALLIGGSAFPLVRQSVRELRSPSPSLLLSHHGKETPQSLAAAGFCEIGQTDWNGLIATTKESRL
ncbi:MAG: cation diffusion facilitator family transporter [Leptolyngbyaceae bacterium]|nr:cation diffusion facilitator family transporter [Leptolyngbyaceae bacterium]